YYLLDGIYMRGIRTGCPCRQRCPTRIGKQIQHLGCGRFKRSDSLDNIIPVNSLLGENTHMLERRKRQAELEGHRLIPVGDMPPIGQFCILLQPVSGSRRASPETNVMPLLPFRVGKSFGPYSLWFGANQYKIAKTFKLFEIATVQQFVIFPICRGEKVNGC